MIGPRVWIVSDAADPEPSSGFFVSRLAEDLATEYSVTLVTQSGASATPVIADPRIAHVYLGARQPPSQRLFHRALSALVFTVRAAFLVARRVRAGDVVILLSKPPILPATAALFKAWRDVTVVELVHDIYPEILGAAAIVRPDGYLMRLLRRLAALSTGYVDRTVVLGRGMKEVVASRRRGAITVIPHWADNHALYPDPIAAERLRVLHGLSGAFVALYMGNVGHTHDVETLLHAAERLRQEPAIRIVLIGRGSRFAAAAGSALRHQLNNVIIMPAVGAGEIKDWLSAADVMVIPMRRGASLLSVPSRLYSALATGTPVVAAMEEAAEASCVLREEGAGLTVAPEDPDALATAIRLLADAAHQRRLMSAAARRAAVTRFTRAHSRDAWLRLLTELCSPRATR